MLSEFVDDPATTGGLAREELAATAVLLLVTGHQTMVDLITNGTHPAAPPRPTGAPVPRPRPVRPHPPGQRAPRIRQRHPHCYGAPLALVEARIALGALLPRLTPATLVEGPPPAGTAPYCAAPETFPSSTARPEPVGPEFGSGADAHDEDALLAGEPILARRLLGAGNAAPEAVPAICTPALTFRRSRTVAGWRGWAEATRGCCSGSCVRRG